MSAALTVLWEKYLPRSLNCCRSVCHTEGSVGGLSAELTDLWDKCLPSSLNLERRVCHDNFSAALRDRWQECLSHLLSCGRSFGRVDQLVVGVSARLTDCGRSVCRAD